MKHATIKKLDNEYFKIIPNKGYILKDKVTKQTYSVVVTKDTENFEVVETK